MYFIKLAGARLIDPWNFVYMHAEHYYSRLATVRTREWVHRSYPPPFEAHTGDTYVHAYKQFTYEGGVKLSNLARGTAHVYLSQHLQRVQLVKW